MSLGVRPNKLRALNQNTGLTLLKVGGGLTVS